MTEALTTEWDDFIEPQLGYVAAALHGPTDLTPSVQKSQIGWSMHITKLCNRDREAWNEAFRRLTEATSGYVALYWLLPLSGQPKYGIMRRFDGRDNEPVLFSQLTHEQSDAIVRLIVNEFRPLQEFARFCRTAFSSLETTAASYGKPPISALFVTDLAIRVVRPLRDVLIGVATRHLSNLRVAHINDEVPPNTFELSALLDVLRFTCCPEAFLPRAEVWLATLHTKKPELLERAVNLSRNVATQIGNDVARDTEKAVAGWIAERGLPGHLIVQRFHKALERDVDFVAGLGRPINQSECLKDLVKKVSREQALFPHAKTILLESPNSLPTILKPTGQLLLAAEQVEALRSLMNLVSESSDLEAEVGNHFVQYAKAGIQAIRQRALEAAESATSAAAAQKAFTLLYVKGLSDAVYHLDSLASKEGPLRACNACVTGLRLVFREELATVVTLSGVSTEKAEPSVVLARYVDFLIREQATATDGGSGATATAGIELQQDTSSAPADLSLADKVAALRPLVALAPSKDVFDDEYRARLAERLLATTDVERVSEELPLIGLLQPEVPGLRMAADMVRDITSAAANREYECNSGTHVMKVHIRLVTKARWPAYRAATYRPPQMVRLYLERVVEELSRQGKALEWITAGGRATLAVHFTKGAKELVTPLSVATLLCALDDREMRLSDLLATTAMAADDATDAFLSLAGAPGIISMRHDAKTEREAATLATANTASTKNEAATAYRKALAAPTEWHARINVETYVSQRRRLEMKLVAKTIRRGGDADEASGRALARMESVDACVVRVMKSRRVLEGSALVDEVVKQITSTSFACTGRMVRDSVNRLIEREYIHRREQGTAMMLEYVA